MTSRYLVSFTVTFSPSITYSLGRGIHSILFLLLSLILTSNVNTRHSEHKLRFNEVISFTSGESEYFTIAKLLFYFLLLTFIFLLHRNRERSTDGKDNIFMLKSTVKNVLLEDSSYFTFTHVNN